MFPKALTIPRRKEVPLHISVKSLSESRGGPPDEPDVDDENEAALLDRPLKGRKGVSATTRHLSGRLGLRDSNLGI